MDFSRITGIAALGFAVTIVLANAIMVPAGLPLTGAEIGEVNAFFGTEGDIVAIASALTPSAWLLATLFGAGAVSALRRFERGRGEAWSLFGFTGLALQNATFAAVIATRLALTSTAARDSATAGDCGPCTTRCSPSTAPSWHSPSSACPSPACAPVSSGRGMAPWGWHRPRCCSARPPSPPWSSTTPAPSVSLASPAG